MGGNHHDIWSLTARLARERLAIVRPEVDERDITANYPDDPVGFARDVLKVWLTSYQEDILRAIAANDRVSISSGRKIGKSMTYSIAALWFYCNFRNARVIVTAATDRQVNTIIWQEIKYLAKRAGVPIPGADQGVKRAATGWKHPSNDSDIRGFTASTAEAIAGTSGAAVLYLCDEASGIDDEIFVAIFGNMAGGNAKVALISNPTQGQGLFYRSHHQERREIMGQAGWFNMILPSHVSPNVTGEWQRMQEWDHTNEVWKPRTKFVPGCAFPHFVTDEEVRWGKDSWYYTVHVLGQFSAAEERKAFSGPLLAAAQARYDETEADGRLWIGVDPAGESGMGDDSVFVARRGARLLEIRIRRGLSAEAHAVECDDLMQVWGRPRDCEPKELPWVIVDAAGAVGAKVAAELKDVAMRAKARGEGRQFYVEKSRSGEKPQGGHKAEECYRTHRDELAACGVDWMREGGAIPDHPRLVEELHAGEFTYDDKSKAIFTHKDDLKKMLGRSPDVADAFFLACWTPRYARQAAGVEVAVSQAPVKHPVETVMGGQRDAWSGSPYGGGGWGGSPYG